MESGHIHINGEKAKSLEVIHRSVGYVTQDTILDGNLTPVEALYFTARFKLNKESIKDTFTRVKDTIKALDL